MKERLMILISLILVFILTSCEMREPDILAPLQEMAEARIIGIRLEPPSEVTFYTDGEMTDEEKRLMVESFLAALVIPEKDLWVNLRIKEPQRIAPFRLGITELGRVMLEQDYLLKKSVATVVYPMSDSGRKFWNRMSLYVTGAKFNLRTWIFPKRAVIADNGMSMFIKTAELDVRQEKLSSNIAGFEDAAEQIILPEVKKYVLLSQEFAPTRQIYRAVICAIWFKNKFLSTIYRYCINTNKTGSFEIPDKEMKYAVFQKYADSYVYKFWRMPDGQNWGGIDFKSPAGWVEVEKQETQEYLKDADRFKISLMPSFVLSSEDLEGNTAQGKIGGIDLNARIEVEEAYWNSPEKTIRAWQSAESISYVFE